MDDERYLNEVKKALEKDTSRLGDVYRQRVRIRHHRRGVLKEQQNV